MILAERERPVNQNDHKYNKHFLSNYKILAHKTFFLSSFTQGRCVGWYAGAVAPPREMKTKKKKAYKKFKF